MAMNARSSDYAAFAVPRETETRKHSKSSKPRQGYSVGSLWIQAKWRSFYLYSPAVSNWTILYVRPIFQQ